MLCFPSLSCFRDVLLCSRRRTGAIPDARTEPNPPRALGHAKTYRCRVPPTAIDIFSVPRNPYFNAAHPPSLPKVAADTTPSDLV
ncbi:hypothetical protein RJ55_03005 [Drechmeria coniospora]|nr:hypothetical protein RJ55_03005 [Drechmeria coniospora]